MNQMRNLTKRIFSVVLLLTMTTIAMAQKIQGYVVDQQSGDSIPYANARYAGTKSGASSDESGRFTVERINGSTLTVTAVGYKPRKVKISEKTPDVVFFDRDYIKYIEQAACRYHCKDQVLRH